MYLRSCPLIVVLILSCASHLFCAGPQEAAAPKRTEIARLPSPTSYGARIEIHADLAYGAAEHQKFDLYLPVGAVKPAVVVCWFGGAFWGGDRLFMEGVASYLASEGFAAIAPGYALGTKDGSKSVWPQAVFDAKAVVRYVRAHPDLLGLDAQKIAALGYSSGAYLAMMVGFTPNLSELEGCALPPAHLSRVSAVVAIAGVCDRRRKIGLPLALLGEGYEDKHDLRVAASPVIYVGPKTVPVYILHGKRDSIADVSSATQLAAALEGAGVRHELRLVDTDHYPISVDELRRIAEWLRTVL